METSVVARLEEEIKLLKRRVDKLVLDDLKGLINQN